MHYSIGVDIGGTNIAIAIVDQTGEVLNKELIPTEKSALPKQIISHINRTITQLINTENLTFDLIKGIGVGSPGPLDVQKGEISSPPNLPLWRNVPIVNLMKDYFTVPVKLENDANVAAIAEKWIGAGVGFNHFIYMTISTGIGSGIVINGELISGKNGNAGDIGHIVVDPSFGLCNCGQEGCLEVVASGTAIAKNGSAIMGKSLTTTEVFDLYYEKVPEIVEFINLVFKRLGASCVGLVNTFDTEAIIIGGGVSNVGTPLFDGLTDYVRKYALNAKGRETKIIPARLNHNQGVIGAAALWF